MSHFSKNMLSLIIAYSKRAHLVEQIHAIRENHSNSFQRFHSIAVVAITIYIHITSVAQSRLSNQDGATK